MLVGLNALGSGVALYISRESSLFGIPVMDVLEVLAGINALTAVGLTYVLVARQSMHR
jgi:hypothetical protein